MRWLHRLKAQTAALEADARREYAKLLRKGAAADDLAAADEKRLAELAGELGLTPEDVERHAQAASQIIVAEQARDAHADLPGVMEAIEREFKGLLDELAEFQKRYAPRETALLERRAAAGNRRDLLSNAESRLASLRGEFPWMFT